MFDDLFQRFTTVIEFRLINFIQIQFHDLHSTVTVDDRRYPDVQTYLSILVILIRGYRQDHILIIQNSMHQTI